MHKKYCYVTIYIYIEECMKKIIFLIIIAIFAVSCSAKKKKPVKKPIKKVIKKKKILVPSVKTGWKNNDIYTVKVVDKTFLKAKDKAKHQVLKDIVNVRVMKGSRYTDIRKVSEEFKKPLENGKVVKQRKIEGGVEIYFQIYGKGLRFKFERI